MGRPTQRELVRTFLAEHPWSTVMEIRDGIAWEHGIKIERIQARLEEIERSWVLHRSDDAYDRVAFKLGERRKEPIKIRAGLVIREDSLQGWQVRTHAEALKTGAVPEDVLRDAERAALAAYRAALVGYLDDQEEDTGLDLFEVLCG